MSRITIVMTAWTSFKDTARRPSYSLDNAIVPVESRASMPSELYRKALDALGPRQAEWTATLSQIAAVEGPDKVNQSGAEVARMLETEHQLSVTPEAAEPGLLKDLLEELCAVGWSAPPADVARAYTDLVGRFARKGPPMAAKPALLFRYINGGGMFEYIRRALDGAGRHTLATKLAELINEARRDGDRLSTWRDVLAFVRDDVVWKALPRDMVRLSGGHSAFVTFDSPDGSSALQRDSAKRVHSALALWNPLQECFLELTYEPSADESLQLPTLADAGWYRFFQSAPPGAPHGLTMPHDPAVAPQPEVVHAVAPTLARIMNRRHIRVLPP